MTDDSRYDNLSHSQVMNLHRACETFEQQLQSGEESSIEQHLEAVSSDVKLPLFQELLSIELDWRHKSGNLPTLIEYQTRFPNWLAEIKAGFAELKLTSGDSDETQGVSDEIKFAGIDSSRIRNTNLTANSSVGPYTLIEPIGEGGMGSVWKARQPEPVRRNVALKIIKAGMDSQEVIARFEAERQALALMSHPNIAKVFDAGQTEAGRPYFVMELVKGEPITKFCDRHLLTAEQRIELFMDVCYAVQHAHQRGIIHRDIKPSNVLVMMEESKPVVKVIDFGLAKAVSQKLTEKTLFTAIGQVVGTPAYMSPEQFDKGGLDIDTRTDVYSLGVMLYQLLTGVTPVDMKDVVDAGYAELMRVICDQDPPRMKQRLSSLGDDSNSAAERRSTDIRKLTRKLEGDLDVIVMYALAREPERRYQSPSDFADDLRRFLGDEPIEARPASALYRFKKLAVRN